MPFDRPTQSELTSAVREFLEEKVLPELSGYVGFNTRVSINVLKILERELQNGRGISDKAQKRLQTLLDTEENDVRELNKILCEAIDKGQFTYHNPELLEHLWQTTMDKLSVDNPRYVSYQREL